MYTLGHDFVPPGIHAGGLRYHGMSPIISALLQNGLIEARAVEQLAIFEAAQLFAMSEGIIPAPESAHAIRVAIDEALKCKETGEEKAILFGLSGHGHFDMSAYDEDHKGNLANVKHPQSEIDKALAKLPKNQRNNE
jgi:predicted alternative tryptophan synthase beta-subunit